MYISESYCRGSSYNTPHRNGPGNKEYTMRLHRDEEIDTSISPPNNEESASHTADIRKTGSKCDKVDVAGRIQPKKQVAIRGLHIEADIIQQGRISQIWRDENKTMSNDPDISSEASIEAHN